jgi:site-specific recombinase XerD
MLPFYDFSPFNPIYKKKKLIMTKKGLPPIAKDIVYDRYLVAQRNRFWCIDATDLTSGILLLMIDLSTRLIVGHMYIHQRRMNDFSTEELILFVKKCLQDRQIAMDRSLTIHSDRGAQFNNPQFKQFCLQQGVLQSMSRKALTNQVIESTNSKIKDFLRIRIDSHGFTKGFKAGSSNDPIRKLARFTKEEVQQVVLFAIEAHNNSATEFNQQLSPFDFDHALFNQSQNDFLPPALIAKNDESNEADLVRHYREEAVIGYANFWLALFHNWKKSHDLEFEQAKRERAALYEQNRVLISKIEMQSAQIEILIQNQEELVRIQTENQRKQQEKLIRKQKRALAVKQKPRDTITPEQFTILIRSVNKPTPIGDRIKVAFTLLYLTGLRVSNLLLFTVANLTELIQKQSTFIRILKRGGNKKIVIGREAKHYFDLIQQSVKRLIQRDRPEEPLFINTKGDLISRVNFNMQLNQALKKATNVIGKRLYTHSFRVAMITDLLKQYPIQDVKNIVGHKDIKTTEVYNRNFLNERDVYSAMQSVLKARQKRFNKKQSRKLRENTQ